MYGSSFDWQPLNANYMATSLVTGAKRRRVSVSPHICGVPEFNIWSHTITPHIISIAASYSIWIFPVKIPSVSLPREKVANEKAPQLRKDNAFCSQCLHAVPLLKSILPGNLELLSITSLGEDLLKFIFYRQSFFSSGPGGLVIYDRLLHV